MNETVLGGIIVGVVVLGLVWVVSKSKKKFKPPVIDVEPEVVDGISIGRYYGDPESKTCVEVVTVENGIVAFRYMRPPNTNNIMSVPKEAFLEKYYKYPNGCDFLVIGDDLNDGNRNRP